MKLSKIRVTALDTYENCPRCFLLQITGVRQASNPNLRFGSLVHKGIEEYHRFEKKVFDTRTAPFLKAYIQAQKPHGIPERKFEIPNFLNSGILLTGTIDLIQDEWIHEHKTSKSRWTQKQVDEHKQATAYAFAYRTLFGKDANGIRFNILVKNKTPILQQLDTWRDDDDFDSWKKWVLEIFDNIEKDRFDVNYGARWHNFSTCPGSLIK